MSRATGIEWTDATWNPIRGCSRVSEGCRHCYAETVANRFCGPGSPYEGLVQLHTAAEGSALAGKGNGKWNGQIRFVEKRLLDPLKWKEPQNIFVNSMSDLFHENVTDEMLDRIFAVMALCPQHTFQVLTKRALRALEYLSNPETWDRIAAAGNPFYVESAIRLEHYADRSHIRDASGRLISVFSRWPLPNVWLGVSVENQKAADERIPLLLQTPAAVRFLSVEPLLGPVCLDDMVRVEGTGVEWHFSVLGCDVDVEDDDEFHGASLDWVIVGGESGPGARPMHPDWARSLRDQCQAAGVPFFFKQWGEWIAWEPEHGPCWLSQHGKCEDHHALFPENIVDDPPGWDSGLGYEEGQAVFQRVGKKAAGHLLDGEVIQQFPEVRA